MNEMDLTDPRFHKRKIHWASLVRDGYNPKQVMKEAQRQGLWRLARSAATKIENDKRLKKTLTS